MTTSCEYRESGGVEALFYDDLPPAERHRLEAHLRTCAGCRTDLEDLAAISDALRSRPVVAAPQGSDWGGFMARLDARLKEEPERRPGRPARASWASLTALAAMLVLTALGVALAMRTTRLATPPPQSAIARPALPSTLPALESADTAGFEAVTEQHLERSKLVVLGLAAKDPDRSGDWGYERGLAGQLLTDTRMYRMAAEDRGLGSIASVMRDLELVLLQASFTDDRDPDSLAHIQRLIRRRDLVAKIDAVALSGL